MRARVPARAASAPSTARTGTAGFVGTCQAWPHDSGTTRAAGSASSGRCGGLRRDAEARAAEAVATLPEAAGSLTALDPAAVVAVIDAWTLLFGAVSFEFFGHYVRTIETRAEHLDHVARTAGTGVGIPGL